MLILPSRYKLSGIGTRPGHVDPPTDPGDPDPPADSCVSSTTNLWLNPLDKADALRMPFGTGAEYADSGDAETIAWLRYSSANLNPTPGAGWGVAWSEGLSSDPLQTVTFRNDGQGGSASQFPVQCRFPNNWDTGPERSGNTLTDREAVVYEQPTTTYPKGRFFEFWRLDNENGTWRANVCRRRAATATSYAPSERGIPASGISLLLTCFRGHEWNTAAGKCEHALGIAVPSKVPNHGPYAILSPNIVWPATSGDNSMANNVGPCPYGRFLGIPPQSKGGPNPNGLGLGSAGSIAWRLYYVFLYYGVILIDQSGGNSFRADQTITTATANSIRAAIGILYRYLRPVKNITSSQTVKGGGTAIGPNCAYNRAA